MEPQAQLLFLMSILVVQDNSVCLKLVSSPQDRLVFVLGKNTTNVVMSWKFTVESGEFATIMELTRLKSADDSNPQLLFGYSVSPGIDKFNSNFYNASKDFQNGPSSGLFNFTIKDMLKQINNSDGSPYTPLSTDYQYKLKVTTFSQSLLKIESRVTALVYAPPVSPALQVDKTTFCINATSNITCNATTGNPPNATVMFYRNDVKIREVKNDREAKATVSINLDKLGVQTFTCQAANLIGSSKNSSLLNVTVKGHPTITQCDNQTSTEGDALSWTCDARGNQPLNTSWVKGDGNTIISSVKTYNISFISRSDAGMYRVTFSNGDECPTASTTVYLTVQYKPEQLAVVNSQGGVLYVNKGQPINITCTATGNPQPVYVWSFKGKQLHSSINSTIVISNATLDDAGMYTCTVINSIGRESINVKLQVNYLMDAICGPKIHTVNDGDNVALNCSAFGIPAVSYTWTVNNKVSQGPTTTFVATRSLNGSMVTCIATNSFERKTCSKTLIVYYLQPCVQNYAIANQQCISVRLDGYPIPTMSCSPPGNLLITQDRHNYTLCGKRRDTTSDCTVGNNVGSCKFTVSVHKRSTKKVVKSTFKCISCTYESRLADHKTIVFNTLKEKIEKMLRLVYAFHKYVTSVDVSAFWPGSVIVEFQLTLIANVSDPLSPFKAAVCKQGGSLEGISIDLSSIQEGTYTLPTTTISTTVETTASSESCQGGQGCQGSQVSVIVLGVLFGVSLIFNVIFVGYFIWRHLTGKTHKLMN